MRLIVVTGLMRSSVGKKAVVAASGFILIGFVVMHLAGNLLIFLGPAGVNAYAHKLRELGPGLWVARGVLLAAAVVHGWVAARLAKENQTARPIAYRLYQPKERALASRTMLLSGLLLLAYLLYHLLHFTVPFVDPSLAPMVDGAGRRDVYAMVVRGFQNRFVSMVYVTAMGVLFLHLSHGIMSAFQSLGLSDARSLPTLRRAARVVALALFVGYVSIPVAVALGVVTLVGRAP